MTGGFDVEAELAMYRERACTGKRNYGAKHARLVAAQMRVDHPDEKFSPYPCPFCESWHVGHSLGMATLAGIATLMRERDGNGPATPGSGTTRRQRRKKARHG